MSISSVSPESSLRARTHNGYLRFLNLANLFLNRLWFEHSIQVSMVIEHNARPEQAVVVHFPLLCHSEKEQAVASRVGLRLVSNDHAEAWFLKDIRDEKPQQMVHDLLKPGGTPDEQFMGDCVFSAAESIRAVATHPDVLYPKPVVLMQQAEDGSFLKKVQTIMEIGTSSNYQVGFTDGTHARFTMPTRDGALIKPGDWLHHERSGNIVRFDTRQIH